MSDKPPDNRTYIQRLLNYKRYIDFLIERELRRIDDQQRKQND